MGNNAKAKLGPKKTVVASVSTQRDADRFRKAALAWGNTATESKKKAAETLVSLGIYTKSGKLTKKYS